MNLKFKPYRFVLLALLVLLGMVVSPVCAGYTITAEPLGGTFVPLDGKVSYATVDLAPDGEAVQRVVVDIPSGTAVNFTLTYGSGSTVSGWMDYRQSNGCDDWLSWYDSWCQYTGVAIDTDIQGYNYRGASQIGRIDIVGYARNETSADTYVHGFIVYDSVFGISDRRAMAFYPVTNPADIVITKFEITADQPVGIAYYKNSRENVLKAATTTPLEAISNWISWLVTLIGDIKSFLLFIFYTFKFFFIDNLLLVVILYFSVSMAYSAISTRDIFQFYKKFFKFQRSMLEFAMSMINYFVQMAASIIPWK